MDDLLVERVLRGAECVPAGQVVSYGMIAELVGASPRLVGRIMATWGANVAWWRVTNASGRLPEAITIRALEQWAAEGTPLAADRHGVSMPRARADAAELAAAWQAACADLPAQ
ncbi:MGMT family protein [Brevibacterium luteolum]|uniref:Cysteine methyltransferase n=1 Tax=Brevibacterium luteolum TaxID=199591 RepID=A0A6G8KZS4_9MICO|nr:MGMT family protein [Brevibacterium luteolum]QIN30302.1 cysteine methyltransferase [Brevibacterium luteolum]